MMEEMEKEVPMEETSQPQQEGPKVSPKEQKEIDAYSMGLAKILHSKETKNDIYEMLKGAPPEKSVPHVALQVNNILETKAREKGKPPSLTVLLNACMYLVSDLLEIGTAGGFFQIESEEQVQSILQDTMQKYIEDGVRKGTVDPVEVQAAAEQYMPDDMKQQALQAGSQAGIPETAGNMQAMESYAMNRERKAVAKTEQKFKAQQEKSALMQNASPQQGG